MARFDEESKNINAILDYPYHMSSEFNSKWFSWNSLCDVRRFEK